MSHPETVPTDLSPPARRSASVTVERLEGAPGPGELGPGDVWVWYAAEEEVALVAGHPAGRAALSEEEWRRRDRLVQEPDRERFLASRVLLRFMLSAAAGVPPGAWRFDVDGHGRPHVAAPAAQVGLPFSITHTAGLVACAVMGAGEVGVDAEARDRDTRTMEVARRFFSDTEVACLEGSPPSRRRDVFFHVWTLKEAYVKALGRGLALPLARFSFDLQAPPPEVPFRTELGDDAGAWAFALEHPTPRHSLAVAACPEGGSAVTVRLTRVTASALPAD